MDGNTVRTALGTLQNNPDAEAAWQTLREGLTEGGESTDREESLGLLQAARERHSVRGEAEAVERLLGFSIEIAKGTSDEAALLREQATVLYEELFYGNRAIEALARAAEVGGGDSDVTDFLAELTSKASSWKEQVANYQSEADGASDDAYKSAMLMRAAEAEMSFAEEPRYQTAIEDLEMALRLDSSNLPAIRLLEVAYRRQKDSAGLIRVLGRAADRAPDEQARIAAGVRLGRLYQHTLGDEEKAAAVFDRVLDSDPGQLDAIEFVTDFYSSKERWDDLVRVYERPLKGAGDDAARLGDMLQVAMLHWKKREELADAAPWFDRIRAIEPAHDGVLAFYREYKASLKDDAGLADILSAAQKVLPADDARAEELKSELETHAQTQADAHKLIEQFKSSLRDAPEDQDTREKLKDLYKQTQGHNALIELLRQELDRLPEDDTEGRLQVMREIAGVYREYIKSDTALVGVLNQIVQLDGKLDEQDVAEVRELVLLYERLNRPRDLLASQKLLAEIVPDLEEKKALYRRVGRTWLDQFSNVQHAMEAFAALHDIDKSDDEAIERLEGLYRKRRAWPELFTLYEEQLASAAGEARIPFLREMAQLAAERLGRAEDAMGFYKEVLDLDPSRVEILDRLEKQAERAKDWGAVADVLERRLAALPEDETRLPVLQKLGGVYAEHLSDDEKAISTWLRVVQVQNGHPRAMRVLRDTFIKAERFDELEDLYTTQGDLEGLAEVLSTAADRTKEAQTKLDLSYRAARVYEEKLGQSARAMRSYERILSIEPTDARAIAQLLPLYEADDKWARVPALLEVLVDGAAAPEDKIELLGKLVDVSSQRLNDRRGAVSYARRAFDLLPSDPRTVEMLDSTCRAAGSWDEMVSALEADLAALGGVKLAPSGAAVASVEEPAAPAGRGRGKRGKKKKGGSLPPPEVAPVQAEPASSEASSESSGDRARRRAVTLRLARVLGEELGRTEDSVALLKALLSEATDEDALSVLSTLLRRESRPDDLRWMNEHRQANVSSADERSEILCEWAAYEEREIGDAARALALYCRAKDADPSSMVALEAVARLSIASGDPELAISAVEQHRDLLSGEARAVKESALAELYAEAERYTDALKAAERALGDGVETGRVILVLQKLVDVPEVRGDAARILSEQYEAGGDSRKEADALVALISETSDPAEVVELTEKLASVYQDKLAEPGGALLVVIKGALSHPTELTLWDRAGDLASVSGRATDLADAYKEVLRGEHPNDLVLDLSRRAAELHEAILHDASGAVPYYERVLKIEADDEHAFGRLKEILTAEERWRELESLYDHEISRLDDESRKIEMLAEVALLAEDIMGDAERAVTYQERILELDAEYSASLAALDRLYTRLSRSEKLLALIERRAELGVGAERHAFLVRSGQLALAAHQPDRAMKAIEGVLSEDPTNYDARDVAEQLLPIGSVRLRAARALEQVYESRDEIRELVRVLGVRVELLRPTEDEQLAEDEVRSREDERRDLLRRIATLRDDRLHDDEGSFDVFAELVPLDPVDAELRDRLIDAGRRLGRSERVVEVLLATSNHADSTALAAEILLSAAEIQTDLLEDPREAEKTLGLVIRLREDEPEAALAAARSLEAIFVRENRGEELVVNLKLQIEIEHDFDRKAELLARVAQLSTDVLGDRGAAIDAWCARLSDNPDDATALLHLTELYEQAEQYSDLARVLEQRRDAEVDGIQRLALSRKLAEVQERHLGDNARAIESYQSLLDEGGADAEVLEALVRLYEKGERWDELADVHERQVEVLDDDGQRLAALAALGKVRALHLNDLPAALEAYRRALSLDHTDQTSRAALLELLSHEDTTARLEAAELLQPIFEGEGNHEKLLSVVEVQAAASDDPSFKVARLETAVMIAEDALDDPGRAMAFAVRGIRAAAVLGDIASWLSTLDRLAQLADARASQVEVLEAIAPDLFDAEQQLTVLRRVAEIRQSDLGDIEGAISVYQKALESAPDDREVLIALEKLHEGSSQWEALLGILERREEVSFDDSERKALAYRRAELLANRLESSDRAIETYELIVDMALEQPAIDSLEKLYIQAERFDDLAILVQRRLDAEVGSRADLRVHLARVYANRQGEVERALDELEQALLEDAQHGGSVAFLEELGKSTEDPQLCGRIASLLEPVYMVRSDYDSVLRALELRLVGSEDLDERRELITRIAQIHEEQREDYGAALEITAKLLADDPSDASTLEEMERLAKVAGASLRLAELLLVEVSKTDTDDEAIIRLAKRAGFIFAAEPGDERALPLLQRALAFEPESVELFDKVDELLSAGGGAEARVELYRSGLESRFDPDDQVKLLQVIADLEEKELKNLEAAIEAHERVLEVDDANVRSLDALTVLYANDKRFEALAELYTRRAEQVAPEDGVRYRLALAALYTNRLERPDAALDQLEEIVRDLPDNREAIERIEALRSNEALKERVVEMLRPLYEQADDWQRLVKLNADRLELSEDPHEKVTVLQETAELWEVRGDDPERALSVLSEAFRLVPDDEDTRVSVERLVSITENFSALASLYSDVLSEHPDLVCRRDLVIRLADLFDARLDDPRQALSRFQELAELDPTEPEPISNVIRLSTLLGDWEALESGLSAQVDAIFDADEQVETLLLLGELRQLTLDNSAGAIQAYERGFEIDERNPRILDRLIALFEVQNEPARLVDLYLARVDSGVITDDGRYDLFRRTATILEKELEDRHRAIECLGQALGARPGDAATIAELNRLYRVEEMWPDLLDNLRLEAGTAETAERRLEVRHEIASILASKLSSFEEAIEAYGSIMDERPDDERALDAVFALAEAEEHLRQQAAELLVPALRQTGLKKRLVKALALRLSVEQEPFVRVETLRRIAEVQEHELSDPNAAFESMLKAVGETPEALELYDELERLAGVVDGWARFVDVLEERAAEIFEPEIAAGLWVRIATTSEVKLAKPKRAIDAYQKAAEQVGDRQDLLDALDRLYTQLDDTDAVVELLDRRMALADTDQAQAKILVRQGQLQLDKQKQPAEALNALRDALGRDLHSTDASDLLKRLLGEADLFDEAFEVLDGVFRERTSGDELAALHQIRVDRAKSPAERLDMRRELALVLEEECKDPLSAQRVLSDALIEDVTDLDLQADVERLLALSSGYADAAEAYLKGVQQAKGLDREVALELCQKAARWYRDMAGERELAEGAFFKALSFDEASDIVLEQIEALQSEPGREEDLLVTVQKRAEIASDSERLAYLRRAKELADKVEKRDVAEAVLRAILDMAPEDVPALEDLTHICRASGDHAETETLLLRRAELEVDPDKRRVLRFDAAVLCRDELSRLDDAIEIFEELFDQDPAEERAADALRAAYIEGKKFEKLAALLSRLIEASDGGRKSDLRVALARLSRESLGDTEQAVSLLESVFADDPAHPDASLALADVYESEGRHEELCGLLERQKSVAQAAGDEAGALALLNRLAGIYEETLKDYSKAVVSWSEIRKLQDSAGALEALLRLHQLREAPAEAAVILEEICAGLSGSDAIERRLELVGLYKAASDEGAVIRTLEATAALAPDDVELGLRLRAEYEKAGAWQKVADLVLAAAEAVSDDKSRLELYREAAQIHLEKRSDPHSGADLLAKASALAPDDREILLELCDALSASGRADESIGVLEKIVESYGGKRSKELGEIHRRLANAYLSKGENEKALGELDLAFRIEPGNIHVLKQLGEVAIQTNDMKKAQQMFRALLLQRLDDKSPISKAEVFCRLGQVHQKLGEAPKAKQFFERALQADDSLVEAQAGLAELG